MKNVVIVAPHFPPSNLAGVHRSRLLSQHMAEFSWNPIIVTTHWRHYEETLDWDLHALVDPSLEVISTQALPTRPIRVIGDIGIRAMRWQLQALEKLRREGRMDFLLITIPSFFSGILGELLYKRVPLPFGIDYIDPWVYDQPSSVRVLSKEWAAMRINERLEPFGVRHASLISGVAQGYFSGVVQRNPHLSDQAVFAAAPYGFSQKDFQAPNLKNRKAFLFEPYKDFVNLVYAGALLPEAHGVLKSLLRGLHQLRSDFPRIADRLRLHFVGTGRSPTDPSGYQVMSYAEEAGVAQYVTEHPHRMGYLDVLNHLLKADGVIIVGSTEAHYTPSKVYQAVQARRPVLALLHEDSTAVGVLQSSGAGIALTLTKNSLPSPLSISDALKRMICTPFDPTAVDWTAFDSFSARESARIIAEGMDEAHMRFHMNQNYTK